MTDRPAEWSPQEGLGWPRTDIAALRVGYTREPLVESQMDTDPVGQFQRWFDEVSQWPDRVPEPNAMVLGTADGQGRPSARTVLLKGVDQRGFVFFTNYTSRKAREAEANPLASLVFPWHAVERQVIVLGAIERVQPDETEAYFRSRPRGSQLGAWTSRQSSVTTREELEARRAELQARFAESEIPVPDFWGGLRVIPDSIEFWHGRPDRLHDRLRYRRDGEHWRLERLSP